MKSRLLKLLVKITSAPLRLCVFALMLSSIAQAQTLAPGAPGKDAQWASAGKQGVGTSASLTSKVWFTLQGGALTDVYYPDVTAANVQKLQFIVKTPAGKFETEQEDTNHEIEVFPGKTFYFRQINKAKTGAYTIYKEYVVDPERNTVLMNVTLQQWYPTSGFRLYVYYDPSLNNSGMHDTAWTQNTAFLSQYGDGAFLAQDGDKASALIAQQGFEETTNGFLGTSDGLTQLQKEKKLTKYSRAEKGNVVQVGLLKHPGTELKAYQFYTLALGFGKTPDEALATANASLTKGFQKCSEEYEKEWSDYVKTLRKVEPKYQAQFNMAAMILKAHEDKLNRGANIASLSVPWGGGDNANENTVAGYHLIWSRDLYQVATAYMALGDKDAALRALDFLFRVQQKPDGSFPQNSFLDGKPFWGSLQLDEVAFPLILAYQLGRTDRATYEKHVKKAADFIVKTGPSTPQERWEEETGYSPSTIAAEIAGLVCAAEIAKLNGDTASATVYLATADDWERKVESWTATTTGKHGDGNYYLRITGNGKPDAGDKIELNNGAGSFDEREIVDAGFLELVRLGIKSPDDPLIAKSVKVIDQILKVETPNGAGFYRYNHDGYGEMDDGRRWNWDGKYTGKGRLWALLSGERGQYELANHSFLTQRRGDAERVKNQRSKNRNGLSEAKKRLDAMLAFANDGLMIPEQVWDKPEAPRADSQFSPNLRFGEGTGSATPLAWSMAGFIRLAVNLQAGKNLDTPDVVYDRYVRKTIGGQTGFNLSAPTPDELLKLKAGDDFTVKGQAAPNSTVAYLLGEQRQSAKVGADGSFVLTAKMPETETTGYLAIITAENDSFVLPNKIGAAKETPLSTEIIEKVKNAQTSPLVIGNKAVFIYRGAAKQVRLAGDFTGWQPRGAVLQEVGEGLKAAVVEFPATARLEYKIIVDGNWISDPLNPNKLNNGVGGENSFFTMPDYKPTQWTQQSFAEDVNTIKPNLDEFELPTKVFGTRKIKAFLPSQYKTGNTAFPVLYLQDGADYREKTNAIEVQENLVRAKKIKPFIIVFIDPVERTKEYWANDAWADFMADELVPAIDAKYRTVKNRDGRALLGASLGGVTSIWTGLRHPDKFARIGGQSSSFWIDNERVVKELAQLDAGTTSYRFYLDDGVFEGVDDSRRVNVMLRAKGFPVTYLEAATGHNWTSWRDRLADAYVALWN